ncbi:hypothetical protein [Nocardia xishanensis]|nr:hypothetical protein [Nocardia xishanensis]
MISTGATVVAAVRLLRHHASDIVVAATHGPGPRRATCVTSSCAAYW